MMTTLSRLHNPVLLVVSLLLILISTASAYSSGSKKAAGIDRRTFLSRTGAAAFATPGVLLGTTTAAVQPAQAADIKVTPIAHTFVASDGVAKPTRENDATRFLTNAKVVYMFEGPDAKPDDLATQVLQLTVKRKADQGPGVTPGAIHVATSSEAMLSMGASLAVDTSKSKDISTKSVVASIASKLPKGDTLIVGPLPSGGTGADGQLVADTASALDVAVGGAREGGVLSVLLDGPKQGLALTEGGYPVSTILWWTV